MRGSGFFLALKYARRELRAGIRGFYIFLACLALGTAAIAGVRSLSEGLIDSLHHDGRFILGGDISLRTVYQPATPEQMWFLNHKIGVVNVVMETRAMAHTQDGAKTALVEVKAVDPFYPLYGKVRLTDEAGKPMPPQTKGFDYGPQDAILPPVGADNKLTDAWGAAVEKGVLLRLGLHVGDSIVLGQRGFIIRAVIDKEPDRVASEGFSLAPRVLISSGIFEKTGLHAAGSQVYYDQRVVMPYVRTYGDMQQAMKKINDAFPHAEWRGRTCFNAAPRVERMIAQLTQFLTLIGFTTLVVGGVGVSNAVRSFLDSKLANIATLKCLGASGGFVTRVYMAMILLLTALGVGLGLILGALGARVAGHFLTAKLALTDQVGIYPGALVLAAVFGFLTSICFSLWPIGRAARVSPNDLFRDLVQPGSKKPGLNTVLWIFIAAQALALTAIGSAEDPLFAAWFMAGAAFVFAVFFIYAAAIRAVMKRVRLPAWPEARMALANLCRPGNISTGVILSMGLSLTVLVAVTLVQDRFSRLLAEDLAPDAPSFFFLDIEPGQKDAFEALVSHHPTARGFVMMPSFRGRITAVNGKPAAEALVDKNESWVIDSDRGFTWTAKQPPYSKVTAGQWWDEGYAGPPAVSIATNVAKAFNIGPGDNITVSVYGAEVTAKILNVRDIQWSSFTMNFAVTFAPGLISKAPANSVATVILDETAEEDLQTRLVHDFPNVTSVRVRDVMANAQTFVAAIAQAVRISAGVTLIAGVLVLAGGIAAARRRHVYDSVVLKVLGATRGRILKTFLLEYGLLGLLAALIAAAFGAVAAWAVLTFVMKLEWSFRWSVLAGVTGLSLSITILAGFAGTWRALRQKPALYLRNQ